MAFAKIPSGGGDFFKPADAEGFTLLVEPKHFFPQQNHPFNPGEFRDEATADVTLFDSNFKAVNVLEEAKFTNGVLANTIGDLLKQGGQGQMFVATVGKPNGKRYWKFFGVSDSVEEKVAKYVETRNAEFDALLED